MKLMYMYQDKKMLEKIDFTIFLKKTCPFDSCLDELDTTTSWSTEIKKMEDWRKIVPILKLTTFNCHKNLEEKCAEYPGDGHEDRYKGADLDVGKHPGQ